MNDVNNIPSQILKSICSVVGSKPIGLHEPKFSGNEWKYLKDCLDSTFVSSIGKYVEKFERLLEEYTGAKYAVAIVNGTSALHLSLLLAGIKKNDEVLLPALTFVASANAVLYCNAIPNFVDSDKVSLGIDIVKLEKYLKSNCEVNNNVCINKQTGRIIRGIMPVHVFGHCSNLNQLLNLAKNYNLKVIEDASEALGSFFKNKHLGTFGLMGVLSFNGNKIITTGGGGAIITNNKYIAQKAKHLSTTAKVNHQWEYLHDDIGYNYRMPNINAALGCAQIEKIEEKIKIKRKIYKKYKNSFSNLNKIKLLNEPKNCRSNFWLQTIILDKEIYLMRDEILKLTNKNKINTRPVWKLISNLDPFKSYPKSCLKNATELEKTIINLPSNY